MNSCVVCHKESELLCQRCRTAYCTRKCQAQDWPEHKAMCIPMPPLVVAKKTELQPKRPANDSQKLRQQTYESQRPKQQTYSSQRPKQQMNDLQKPKQRTNASQEPNLQTNASQEPKQRTNDLQEPQLQRNVSQEPKQQTKDLQEPNLQMNDSQDPKQQKNDLQEPNLQMNDSQEPKKQTYESFGSLRPPKTKLQSPITLSNDSKISLFDNPFKRNSQKIAFNANDIKNNPSPSEDKLSSVNYSETKAHPRPGEFNPIESIEKETSAQTFPDSVKTTAVKAEKDTTAETLPASVETSAAKDDKAEIIVPQRTSGKLFLKELLREVVESQQVNEPILTLRDIEIIPLAAGKKIVCLDTTNLAKLGYISSCVSDGKAVAFIHRLSAKITDYCNRTEDCYRPQCNELCLSLFEDNEWYRAVVVKVIDSDTFEINFIDFGNVTTACSKNIRKMPREFLHHCLVNKCYIKGFQDESTETKMKMAEFFTNTPVFEAAKLELLENGLYEIELNC